VLKVAVLAGHGLVCLPIYLVGDLLQSGRLVTVLDDYTPPPLTLAHSFRTTVIYRLRSARSSTFSPRALGESHPRTAGAAPPANSLRCPLLTEGR
jgi:DNA-binding transcriptional LysR family regulator